MISGVPMCLGCKHYDKRKVDGFTCEAFPGGIPPAIILNSQDHSFPVEGDHGIQYESNGGPEYGLAKRPEVQSQP